MTAAVGWAVVGPEGVEVSTFAQFKVFADELAGVMGLWADNGGLAAAGRHGGYRPGYRLARVRIEVIDESDDE